MKWEEFKEIAGVVGYPAAILFFMGWILFRNGGFKTILRGDRSEEIAEIKADIRDLETESGYHKQRHDKHSKDFEELDNRLHQVERDIAVLKDRSNRS